MGFSHFCNQIVFLESTTRKTLHYHWKINAFWPKNFTFPLEINAFWPKNLTFPLENQCILAKKHYISIGKSMQFGKKPYISIGKRLRATVPPELFFCNQIVFSPINPSRFSNKKIIAAPRGIRLFFLLSAFSRIDRIK